MTYLLIATLAAIVLWLATEWHRMKEERNDALTQLLETQADADTSDWYAKRAFAAEERVKALEEQLNGMTIDQWESDEIAGEMAALLAGLENDDSPQYILKQGGADGVLHVDDRETAS
jgi:Flp pilus assembly protein TadB